MMLHLPSFLLLLFGTIVLCVATEPTAIEIALQTLDGAPSHFDEDMLVSMVEDIIVRDKKILQEKGRNLSASGTASARNASSRQRISQADIRKMVHDFNINPDHRFSHDSEDPIDTKDIGDVSAQGAIIDSSCIVQTFMGIFSYILNFFGLPKSLGDKIGNKIWSKLPKRTRREIFDNIKDVSDTPFEIAEMMGNVLVKIGQQVSIPGAITNEINSWWTWLSVTANIIATFGTGGLFFLAKVVDKVIGIVQFVMTVINCIEKGSFTPPTSLPDGGGQGGNNNPRKRVLVKGDFDGDGRMDIAIVNQQDREWRSIPIAFSNGDGSWTVTNERVGSNGDFASWAGDPDGTVEIITGDFNGDGRTDIALVKTSGIAWSSIPIAFADGAGKWKVTNHGAANFAKIWAMNSSAKVITGDFNGDKRTDIALVNSPDWKTIPIAFANGDGTWTITNKKAELGVFDTSKLNPNSDPVMEAALRIAMAAFYMGTIEVVTGDFNGDGRTDIALVKVGGVFGRGWSEFPIAYADDNGKWKVASLIVGEFGKKWATRPVKVISGDFNGDGRTDIALINPVRKFNWKSIPLALSNEDGICTITNHLAGTNGEFATKASDLDGPVEIITGDFNGDGRTDIALVKDGIISNHVEQGWPYIPIAYADGSGKWSVSYPNVGEFGKKWATRPVEVISGDFNGDGRTDILLMNQHRGWNWKSIPLALSNERATWTVENEVAGDFAGKWAYDK